MDDIPNDVDIMSDKEIHGARVSRIAKCKIKKLDAQGQVYIKAERAVITANMIARLETSPNTATAMSLKFSKTPKQ